ncbi:sigma-70 family RNA polymerase sigma factor [Aquisediminimonas profunda]|uniref:sigma-70 family RNA polymerase sigma factor n=1 Tax=Aquisediminimonas profunda TaxID=1550733 RepID=UPI001C632B73|nr:sigma-70 family RNA polymerase sigma factor [Aquisediminimonas profunda]
MGGLETKDPDKLFRDQLVALLPSLRAFSRGLCGHREMADDLAQDTVMRAWAARESYLQGSNFRAWMFMIMRNQFYTTIRKNARMTSLDPEVAERVLVVAPAQQNGLNVEDVAKALQKLPAEQREVLLLIGANGLSYEEAAEVTGCAMGTIKSRLARGRTALAALIDGPDDDSLFSEPKPKSKKGEGQDAAQVFNEVLREPPDKKLAVGGR